MKTIVTTLMLLLLGLGSAWAQQADIKFDSMTHNFGTFPEDSAQVSHTFTFTNVGDGPLIIHQIVTTCGCTATEYTQEPVLPGKTGTIKVNYNGKGRLAGHFTKSIFVYTNTKNEMSRLSIEGIMLQKE